MRDGWAKSTLGEVVDVLTGFAFKSSSYTDETGIRLLRGDNVVQGRLRWDDACYWPEAKTAGLERYFLEAGDSVVALDRTWVKAGLKASVVRKEDLPSLLVQRVARLRAKPCFDARLVASHLQSHRFIQMAKSAKTETAVPHISPNDVRDFPVAVPPIEEQRRIAAVLDAWDEAIATAERLVDAKRRRLSSLRAGLIRDDLPKVPLRSLTQEIKTRNGGGSLSRESVMGVTNSAGIVPMREQTIAEDISRYLVVPCDAFAYNPMRINVGSIARNVGREDILVSPDYVVFRCLPEKMDARYLDHLRETSWWHHYINAGGAGSVRQRTYYNDLAAMKPPVPSYEEQLRLAEVLEAARDDVELTATSAELLRHQKRGLMQKLLTGEWRVPSSIDRLMPDALEAEERLEAAS